MVEPTFSLQRCSKTGERRVVWRPDAGRVGGGLLLLWLRAGSPFRPLKAHGHLFSSLRLRSSALVNGLPSPCGQEALAGRWRAAAGLVHRSAGGRPGRVRWPG